MAKLFKKDAKGKIQQWEIIVDTVNGAFYTISGEVNGKLTTTKPTQCIPKNVGKKNASTALDQAFSESKSKITKKKEDGYTENIEDVDKAAVFEVMLAKNYEDYKDEIKFPIWCQPKLDGIRARTNITGMYSRNNKWITSCPHIWQACKTVIAHLSESIRGEINLDGELYAHAFRENFNRICELTKRIKCTADDLAASANLIQYWIYDIAIPGLKFSERTKLLKAAIEAANEASGKEILVYVPTELCKDQETLDKFYDLYVEAGYEGQMVRIDDVYENKRSRFLLKRKEFQDAEFRIIGVGEGTGERSDMVGYFLMLTHDEKQFKSNIKGSFEYLKELWEAKDTLIGKTATIKFFNYTPDKIPRFPYVIKIDRESYE